MGIGDFFSSIGDAFSKNGAATRFCEGLPVIGYVAAAGQAMAGNTEEAKRAAAKCTGSTLATAGTVVGGLAGGPAGALALGSLTGAAGTALENAIGQSINDPNVRKDITPLTVENVLATGALNGAVGIVGGGGGAAALREAGKLLGKEVATSTGKELMKNAISGAVTSAISQGAKNVVETNNQPVTQEQTSSGGHTTGGGPQPKTEPEPQGKEKKKVISEANNQKIQKCAFQCKKMNEWFPVVTVTGACRNTWPQIEAVYTGQDWNAGKKLFLDAMAYFDGAWERQGGTVRAAQDMIAGGHAKPGFAQEEVVVAKISAERAQLVKVETEALISLETEFDLV